MIEQFDGYFALEGTTPEIVRTRLLDEKEYWGGAWIVAINGFEGISVKEGKLVCEPNLPKNWQGMHFKLKFMGKIYQIDIENGTNEVKKL